MASFGDDIDRMLEGQAGQYFDGANPRSSGGRQRGGRGDRRRGRSRSRERRRERRSERGGSDRRSRMTSEELSQIERERDQRTVFAAQIHPKNEEREIFEFFSDVGKVVDIQLIRDTRTLKSKGLAYIEFEDRRSVPHALALSGRNLNGYPVLVQMTQSDRGYTPAAPTVSIPQEKPKTLLVRNLHKKLSEDDIVPIFNAFGEVRSVDLVEGKDSNECFIEFRRGAEATTAHVQLNGLEVVGLKISVEQAGDDARGRSGRGSANAEVRTARFEDESGNGGVVMSLQDKQSLMSALAKRAGLAVPQQNQFQAFPAGNNAPPAAAPTSATQCLLLTNMFDPATETDPDFDLEIREDVREEVSAHGRLNHIYVDKSSHDGKIYLKFEQIDASEKAFKALDGRWFAQNRIVASYMQPADYEKQFPGV